MGQQHRQQRRAIFHQLHFFQRGGLDFEDHIGLSVQGFGVVHQPTIFISFISKKSAATRALFH